MSKPNKIIAIIAPSSAPPNQLIDMQDSIDLLKSKGFDVNMPNDILGGNSPFESNTIDYRVKHLKEVANDDSTSAVCVLRGGYSSTKVAEKLYMLPSLFQKKLIVGFSDVTALFVVLNQRHNWLCVHGPTILQLAHMVDPKCVDQLFDIIEGKISTLSITDLNPLNSAVPASGKLVGGNLCMLQTTIGTDWQINCRNKILFLEDCNEPGYKIDRMLTHLKQSHILDGVKAIIFGEFSTIDEDNIAIINYSLSEFARGIDCPVYKTNAFGHGYMNTPLIIGADAEIIIEKTGIELHYNWKNLSFHD